MRGCHLWTVHVIIALLYNQLPCILRQPIQCAQGVLARSLCVYKHGPAHQGPALYLHAVHDQTSAWS